MARQTANKGNCYLCGQLIGKSAFKRHLLAAHACGDEAGQDSVLLKIEDADSGMYWLYLDMSVSSTLKTLDTFLRDIWLECCNHMSCFFTGPYDEIGMSKKISSFPVGSSFLYEYDFGDTTRLKITVRDYIKRPKQRKSIRLLGRNEAYRFSCSKCGKVADYICCECMYGEENPFLCADCADAHEHDFMLPVVNSPRMGVCGYCGDQDIYEFNPDEFELSSK